MRILHVIDSAGVYGAENMLLDLALEQREMGHQPVIASLGHRGAGEKGIEREAAARGLTVERFRMKNGPNYPAALGLLRYARQGQIDLLHTHGYKGNILLGVFPRRWRGLPLVTTVHGYTSLQRLTRMKIYEWLDARLLQRLDAVVLVDASVLRHPRLRGCRPFPFQVVHNGLRPAGAAPRLAPVVEAFCRGGQTIGAVGRLSPEKGYHHLLEAFARLHRKSPDCRLLLIGEGGERQRLERQAEHLRIADRLLLPGFLPGARHYLPLLAAFVISSASEGLPISLLEAMEAGTPAVCTSVGAIPEVLDGGRAGLLVPPGDPHLLAAAIERLLTAPEAAGELAGRGAARVREHYSSRSMALQYERIYDRLLEPGREAS